MGMQDTVTKIYMGENAVFADAFNFLIYDGRQVIDPDSLRAVDVGELAFPFGGEGDGGGEAVQKYRDILKSATIMQDGTASYVLLGIENQTDIHYAMPVRNMIYDALQYGRQVSDIASKHRKSGGGQEKTAKGEYLSGFYRSDKLTPVITLVVHFGATPWDGPLSLHEMMAVKNPELMQYIQDYRIHLIDPAKITPSQLEKFSSSLREVLGYIKYSRRKDELSSFLNSNSPMLIEANAARVIKAITKTPIKISNEAEVIDMCKAVEDMMIERENKGKLEAFVGLVKDGLISVKDASARLGMTEDTFKKAMQENAG